MVQPSRRQFLSALSAGGGTLIAGCTASPDEANDTPTATAEDDRLTESTQSAPEFPGDTTSDACPPFDTAAQVVCYQAVDSETMPLVLAPETQTIQPGQPTAFTLRNQSEQQFQTNYYHWQLYKRVDGDWYFILPQEYPEPLALLEAGDEHSWTLTVRTGRVSDGASIDNVMEPEALTIAGLGGGDYAFGTDGWFESGSYEDPIALATGFELNAEPLQLTPTTAIAETELDGNTLVARSTRGEANDADKRDTYILERIDGAETAAQQVIIEQVVRNNQLRDAIALIQEYDVTRVRLTEFSNSIPPFGVNEPQSYEFRGDYYRVTTTKGGSS